jgi:hypothetical protein
MPDSRPLRAMRQLSSSFNSTDRFTYPALPLHRFRKAHTVRNPQIAMVLRPPLLNRSRIRRASPKRFSRNEATNAFFCKTDKFRRVGSKPSRWLASSRKRNEPWPHSSTDVCLLLAPFVQSDFFGATRDFLSCEGVKFYSSLSFLRGLRSAFANAVCQWGWGNRHTREVSQHGRQA